MITFEVATPKDEYHSIHMLRNKYGDLKVGSTYINESRTKVYIILHSALCYDLLRSEPDLITVGTMGPEHMKPVDLRVKIEG